MARRPRKEPETAAYVVLADDLNDPLELIEGEAAERAALSRATQLTADVITDLETKGPLFDFVRQRYADAVEALTALIDHDPADAAGIYALQRRTHPFIDAVRFITDSIENGASASETIERNYGNGADDPAD